MLRPFAVRGLESNPNLVTSGMSFGKSQPSWQQERVPPTNAARPGVCPEPPQDDTNPLVFHGILSFVYYPFHFFYRHDLGQDIQSLHVRTAYRTDGRTSRAVPRLACGRCELARPYVPGAFCSDIRCRSSGLRSPSFQSGRIQYLGPAIRTEIQMGRERSRFHQHPLPKYTGPRQTAGLRPVGRAAFHSEITSLNPRLVARSCREKRVRTNVPRSGLQRCSRGSLPSQSVLARPSLLKTERYPRYKRPPQNRSKACAWARVVLPLPRCAQLGEVVKDRFTPGFRTVLRPITVQPRPEGRGPVASGERHVMTPGQSRARVPQRLVNGLRAGRPRPAATDSRVPFVPGC